MREEMYVGKQEKRTKEKSKEMGGGKEERKE